VLTALIGVAVASCGGGSDATSAAASQTNTAPAQSVSPPSDSISGTPATQVQAGQAYSFTPTATGAAGATLMFSVQNKPAWATFSTASGQLSGTPSSAQVGSYANIVISVSDGTANAALTPFSITVSAPPAVTSGTATVSWMTPTTNTDGSQLAGLSGYKIDYGNSADSLTQTATVSDPSATSYTIQGLAAGTWYFAISDFTSSGAASALSTLVTKTIQ